MGSDMLLKAVEVHRHCI